LLEAFLPYFAFLRRYDAEEAERLIAELSHEEFKPEQYQDEYRNRVLELAGSKVEGKEITTQAPEAQRAQVIDLMDALKQSLAKRAGTAEDTAVAAQAAPVTAKKPPVKAPRRTAAEAKERKAQAGRK